MTDSFPATAACAFGDPACPCQGGDVCHYVDDPLSETLAMTPITTAAHCSCERLWRDRYHQDRDCPQRFEAFIIGNAVDGYEVGVSDEGDIMEGRVVQRHDGPIRTERKARKIASKMLADERKRRQTDVRERVR